MQHQAQDLEGFGSGASHMAGRKGYRNSSGEVEARTVQKRMNLTPEERRARPPWLDYDVPEDQQIVRFGGSGAQMSEGDYRGEHGAPDKESGSPLHDVTANGIYPKEFYGPNGLRYYGTGDDALDARVYSKIQRMKDKPDEMVAVWRAVPFVEGKSKGLTLSSSHINPGDWVTIDRQYALDHGESALNGHFHISKRMVPARELFTAGDSMAEWGWSPEATKSSGPLYSISRDVDPLGYYSHALEAARSLKQAKGTPEQMLAQRTLANSLTARSQSPVTRSHPILRRIGWG